MTVLRDPVDRVISHYYFHRQNEGDPGHILAVNHTFEEWLQLSPAGNNDQVRYISGISTQFHVTNRTLDLALHHLRGMAVVGLTERYHETLFLLKYIAGLRVTRYKSVNKGRRRPSLDEVPPETVELIKKHNWADIELYRLGKEIFEKQISAMPKSFFADVEDFNRQMTRPKTNRFR